MKFNYPVYLFAAFTSMSSSASPVTPPSYTSSMHLQAISCIGGKGFALRTKPINNTGVASGALLEWTNDASVAIEVQRRFVGTGAPDDEVTEHLGLELRKDIAGGAKSKGLPGRVLFALSDSIGRVRHSLQVNSALSSLSIVPQDDGSSLLHARLTLAGADHDKASKQPVLISCVIPYRSGN